MEDEGDEFKASWQFWEGKRYVSIVRFFFKSLYYKEKMENFFSTTKFFSNNNQYKSKLFYFPLEKKFKENV